MFNSVGGKVALLKLALDRAIAGDDEPIPLADRPAIKAILAESDPRKALMLWVQTVTDVAGRTTPLGEVLIAAADIDRVAGQLLAEASSNRMLGATLFIRYLASLDGLAACLTPNNMPRNSAGRSQTATSTGCWSPSATGAPPTSADGCPTASR